MLASPFSRGKPMPKFIDPDGLIKLGNLELVARQVVEGFLTGRHRSTEGYDQFLAPYLEKRARMG
jgi:hypothetical protein